MLGRLLEGRRGVFLSAVRGTEWSQFLDYLSPSFLDVMPLSALLSTSAQLTRHALGGSEFDALVDQLEERRRVLDIAELLSPDRPLRDAELDDMRSLWTWVRRQPFRWETWDVADHPADDFGRYVGDGRPGGGGVDRYRVDDFELAFDEHVQ